MPIVSGTRQYVLGRECRLEVEGVVLAGVADVLLRETTTEVDATGYGHDVQSTVVTQRTIEIQLTVPDMTTARWLASMRQGLNVAALNLHRIPKILDVTLSGGLIEFNNLKFTIHDIEGDEQLNGIVAPRFTLRQWGGGAV